jgi:hypothetical protein
VGRDCECVEAGEIGTLPKLDRRGFPFPLHFCHFFLKRNGERKHPLEEKCLNNFIFVVKNSNLSRHRDRDGTSDKEFFS